MFTIFEQTDVLIQSLYHEQTHVHVETSHSTNSELLESIKQGRLNSEQVHVLTAEAQTKGRGQGSRSWQSPKGNVYLSLYYPVTHSQYPLKQPISGLLSLCIGYYLAQMPIIQQINEYREALNLPVVGVKWANDIGFYETTKRSINEEAARVVQFRKLSGILIEPTVSNGQIVGVVVGVGMNVHKAPTLTTLTQEGMSYQSVSLIELMSQEVDSDSSPRVASERVFELNTKKKVSDLAVVDLYQPINQAIFQAILTHQKIMSDKVALTHFLTGYAQLDILYGRQLKVMQDNLVTTGEMVGIDEFGRLKLQKNDSDIASLFTGRIDVIS